MLIFDGASVSVSATWGQDLCNRRENSYFGTDTPGMTEASGVATIHGFSFFYFDHVWKNYQTLLEFIIMQLGFFLPWLERLKPHGIFSLAGDHHLKRLF